MDFALYWYLNYISSVIYLTERFLTTTKNDTKLREINMFTKKSLGLTFLSLVLLGVSGVTRAAVIYEFDSTEVGAFGPGPYGSVTLTQNADDVDVTVDLRSDLNFVNTGGPHAVFSFNATGVLVSDITNVLFNGVANPVYSIATSGINTPFGTFDFLLDCTTGCSNGAPGQQSDPLTFTVLNALETDLVGLSSGGTDAYFAADVICVTGDCFGATGAIGAVPVPAAVWLFGSGLIGLVGFARRKKS